MLTEHFYILNTLNAIGDDKHLANITLVKTHVIFQAHFPGNPVTPGVCMMQVIKELLERITGKGLTLIKSGDIKFTALIDPFENDNLDIELDLQRLDDGIRLKAQVSFNTTLALKMNGNYKFL